MALATQCPHCQTTFRVAHDQLKLRAGLVRCGACKEVFNGLEHLLQPDDFPQPAATEPRPPAAPEAEARAETAAAQAADGFSSSMPETLETAAPDTPQSVNISGIASAADSIDADQPPVAADGAADDPLQRMTLMDFTVFDEPSHASASQEPEHPVASGAQEAERQLAAEAPDELSGVIDELQRKPWRGSKKSVSDADQNDPDPEDPAEPEFVRRARRKQRIGRTSRMIMGAGAIFLFMALLTQAAYTFRNPLAARFPQIAPALAAGCTIIGCRVELPAKIDAVSLESSELQALPSSRNAFVLTSLLRNRSATVQAWPNIELTLNDINEKAIARRVFAPRDYLLSAQEVTKGFAANSEQPVKLFFELTQLKASGYRVYLFYP